MTGILLPTREVAAFKRTVRLRLPVCLEHTALAAFSGFGGRRTKLSLLSSDWFSSYREANASDFLYTPVSYLGYFLVVWAAPESDGGRTAASRRGQ